MISFNPRPYAVATTSRLSCNTIAFQSRPLRERRRRKSDAIPVDVVHPRPTRGATQNMPIPRIFNTPYARATAYSGTGSDHRTHLQSTPLREGDLYNFSFLVFPARLIQPLREGDKNVGGSTSQ